MKIPEKTKREDVYIPWKPAHLKSKIRDLKKGKIISPTHIQVDLEGRCSHNCTMCFYRNAGFKHLEFVQTERIPPLIAKSLFYEMANLKVPAVELTGGGEPLMHPSIKDILDIIAEKKLELGLVTNGSLLNEDILNKIKHPKWIRFSMDSATEKTRMLVHRSWKGEFGATLENLQRVIDRKFKDCKIGVSYIIQPENIDEITKAAELYKEAGVDNVRFSYAFTTKYDKLLTQEERNRATFLLNQAKRLEDKKFKVFVMEGRLDDFAPAEKTFSFCGYQMFTFQIGVDCMVYPCCILKYYKKYAFGDLRKQSLKDIIFGEKRKKYIESFDVDKCLPCWLKNRNEFIEYLLVDKPAHVNFV